MPPLRNAIRRHVREAAPYIRSPLRNLPPHPSGPRPDTFPPGGRLRTAARAAPTANLGAVSFFVGAGHWPARRGSSAIPEPTLIRLASLGTFPLEGGRLCGRDKSLSPLSRCVRHLPLIRGVVPSPTGFKDTFRVWVGEALGPPADPWKSGGPVCRPYGESGSGFFFRGAGHWPARCILKYDKSKQGRPDGAAPVLPVYKNSITVNAHGPDQAEAKRSFAENFFAPRFRTSF